MFKSIHVALALGLLFLHCGCVPTAYLTNAKLTTKLSQLHKIVILPPRIDTYSVGGGGPPARMDEWSQMGSLNVATALEAELRKKSQLQVTSLDVTSLPTSLKEELEQTQSLFDAVNLSISLHIYGSWLQRLEEKINNFDYSLGPEIAGLNTTDADAFVLVTGRDLIPNMFGRALIATLLVTPPPGIYPLLHTTQAEMTAMTVALVDARSGEILLHLKSRSGGPYDLRDPISAAAFVKKTLEDFPIH